MLSQKMVICVMEIEEQVLWFLIVIKGKRLEIMNADLFMHINISRTATLIGVSSYGIGCQSSIGGRKLPSVFGRISSALSWIRRMTSQARSCSRNTAREPQSTKPSRPSPNSSLKHCESCGKRNVDIGNERIVGGTVAEPNEFPWAALLRIDDTMRCGGSLINDR